MGSVHLISSGINHRQLEGWSAEKAVYAGNHVQLVAGAGIKFPYMQRFEKLFISIFALNYLEP